MTGTNFLLNDYRYGALNILWSCTNGHRTLIFAYIELFPNEFPIPIEIDEVEHNARKIKTRFYYRRIVASAEILLNWYQKALQGEIISLFWQQDNEKFESTTYEQEPIYPDLLLSNNLPFLQDFMGCVRCHFLFANNFSENLRTFCLEDREISNFINDNFKFDITLYSEFLGSICLIAINPLIRSIRPRLISDENTKTERVSFFVEPRNGVDISELKLLFIEKRALGYKRYVEKKLDELHFTLDNIGEIEEIAYAVTCSKRGLLSWDDFHGFMKSISVNMDIITGINKVNVPTKDYKDTEETYEVPRYTTQNFSVGKIKKDRIESLSIKLFKSRKLREQKNIAENTQKLFYENPKDATQFVRELISKARDRVIIIDPYVKTRELFKFALSMRPGVKTTLITSSLVLKGKTNEKEAENLAKNIENNLSSYEINAYVMLGDSPAFHDRFIFIDDEVWVSGNSLADIGKRASIILKSPNPSDIQNIFYNILNDKQKIVKLDDWIKNHETIKESH